MLGGGKEAGGGRRGDGESKSACWSLGGKGQGAWGGRDKKQLGEAGDVGSTLKTLFV